ncbi:alpha/beta fold hydrolase [Verrucomicrobiaceae bacterium R5-34]|nr:alpha/beta fold hydrolase [Verrucomicrobiaceae bacterium R5-34]
MKTWITLAILSALVAIGYAEDVSIQSGGFTIKGTLLTAGEDKTTAVLQIAGSGPTDRDGNTTGSEAKNDSHKLLAVALHSKNITTLRYDKRGVGASGADQVKEAELLFDHYVDDAVQWCQFLRQRGYQNIILLGHSEGALIATLAAKKTECSGLVVVAGAGRKASVLLSEQLQAQLPPAYFRRAKLTLKALSEGNQVQNTVPALEQLFRASVQPYLISWFKYDPAEAIAKVEVPVLIVQGSTDLQTTVRDAKIMHEAAKGSQLKIIKGMNHVLKKQSGDLKEQMKSYNDPTLPLHPDLLPALNGFLQQVRK